jgi:Icc-related predicted phosphoesterase
MKIVFISDTHGQHENLVLPEGDMIIHAGDVSKRGGMAEMEDFLYWYESLPFKHKVFTVGNHDFLAENAPSLFKKLIPDNCIYLENNDVVIEGIRIWGSPITPWFYDWAFNRQRGADIAKYWAKIPKGTDILVTHGPPHDILDRTTRGDLTGCEDLRLKIEEIKPKYHVFGHIHEAYGMKMVGDTTFINASILNEQYRMVNAPVVVDFI